MQSDDEEAGYYDGEDDLDDPPAGSTNLADNLKRWNKQSIDEEDSNGDEDERAPQGEDEESAALTAMGHQRHVAITVANHPRKAIWALLDQDSRRRDAPCVLDLRRMQPMSPNMPNVLKGLLKDGLRLSLDEFEAIIDHADEIRALLANAPQAADLQDRPVRQASQNKRGRPQDATEGSSRPKRQRHQSPNASRSPRGPSPQPSPAPHQDAPSPHLQQGTFVPERVISQGAQFDTFNMFLDSAYENLAGMSLPEARERARPEECEEGEAYIRCRICHAYVEGKEGDDGLWYVTVCNLLHAFGCQYGPENLNLDDAQDADRRMGGELSAPSPAPSLDAMRESEHTAKTSKGKGKAREKPAARWCWCQEPEDDNMLTCLNEHCPSGQRFHRRCVCLENGQTGENWHCSENCFDSGKSKAGPPPSRDSKSASPKAGPSTLPEPNATPLSPSETIENTGLRRSTRSRTAAAQPKQTTSLPPPPKKSTKKSKEKTSALTSKAKPVAKTTIPESEPEPELWCYCQKPAYGDMCKCCFDDCPIEWFHENCIEQPEEVLWNDFYCSQECRDRQNRAEEEEEAEEEANNQM